MMLIGCLQQIAAIADGKAVTAQTAVKARAMLPDAITNLPLQMEKPLLLKPMLPRFSKMRYSINQLQILPSNAATAEYGKLLVARCYHVLCKCRQHNHHRKYCFQATLPLQMEKLLLLVELQHCSSKTLPLQMES
jgi:hypothetical protein